MTGLTISLCVLIGLLVVLCGLLTRVGLQADNARKWASNLAASNKINLSASYYQAVSMQLANELISRDPHFYLYQYRRLWSKWKSLENDKILCAITFAEIAHRVPMQQDFNIINEWDHVSVGCALGGQTNLEIWDAYEDIKLIQATQSVLKNSGQNTGFESEAKDHIAPYIKELENTQFLIEMQSAEVIYFDLVHLNNVKFDPEIGIHTTSYNFIRLPPSGYASRVGVHIKSSGKYGIIEYSDHHVELIETDYSYSSGERWLSHEPVAYQSTRKEVFQIIKRL
jgi:hypothetical protein